MKNYLVERILEIRGRQFNLSDFKYRALTLEEEREILYLQKWLKEITENEFDEIRKVLDSEFIN